MEDLLRDNPHAGRPTHRADVRRLPLARARARHARAFPALRLIAPD
jgi:hypothetical protein